MTGKEAYDQAVADAHTGSKDDADIRLAELAALAEFGLGYPLDQPTLMKMSEIQTDLRQKQLQLANELMAGGLTPARYLEQLNVVLRENADRNLSLLGAKRFDAIFGEAGRHPEGLIDPEVFLGSRDRIPAH